MVCCKLKSLEYGTVLTYDYKIVMYKKRHVIAVYFSVVDKQQIKEGNDDRDSFFF